MHGTESPRRSRYAILLAKAPPPELEDRIAAGEHPRVEYLDLAHRLGAELIDFHDVAQSRSRLVRALAEKLGPRWGLAMLGYLRRREFDAVYLTGEDVGIPMALLARLPVRGPSLTVVVHNADTPKRRAMLRPLARAFDRIICLGSSHEELLVKELGIPGSKVEMLHNWIDHRFFSPLEPSGPGDYALSVGMEQRDYRTLQDAAHNLPFRFHVVGSGFSSGAGFAPAEYLPVGSNFTLGSGYDVKGLRALYGGARLVVLPLRRARYAAGVTGILEAMAMGKAVITTASPGISDYVRGGRVGRVVPIGDVQAMRDAITELWHDTDRLAEIGRQNRAWIEQVANTDHYVAQVAALMGAPPQAELAHA